MCVIKMLSTCVPHLCACLQVVPYDAVWRLCPDSKTLASILLYEKLKAKGAL